MTAPTYAQTAVMHSLYVQLTGFDVPHTLQRHHAWEVWFLAGFKAEDLTLVVKGIKHEITKGRRFTASFRFRNLIEDIAKFEDDLQQFKAEARVKRPDYGLVEVFKATGRSAEKSTDAISAAQALERTKLAASLRQWKAENL